MKTQLDPKPIPGFSRLRRIAARETGLAIEPTKLPMIQSRLRHRMRALNLESLSDYCDYVEGTSGRAELPHMISALTTNVSSFFREGHHFEFLKTDLLPRAVEQLEAGGRVRFWSAGCSTGQEPLSLAMTALEYSPLFASADFRILATDVDRAVLKKAHQAIYPRPQLDGIPPDLSQKYFVPVERSKVSPDAFGARRTLRNLISYRHLNLHADWPMKGQFDLILCRNVVIYFSAELQATLWHRFARQLKSGGYFVVGHSERVSSAEFSPCGATIYRPKRYDVDQKLNKRLEHGAT